MRRWMQALALPGLVLLSWEIAFHTGVLRFESLSHPAAIAAAGWGALLDGTLAAATVQTFKTALFGLLIGSLAALALGIVLGLFPTLEAVMAPSLDAVRPVPAVALLPLALLLFGFGVRFEASIVAFGCFWPVLLMTIAAVRSIDARLLEVGELLEAPPVFRVLRLILPAAIARIFLGIRIAAGIALALAITVEIAANPYGLGYAMVTASQAFNSSLLWAELLWVGIVGWSFNLLLVSCEQRWLARYAVAGSAR
jgi:NitT/TauT family transport system permease protein